jgi:hypothetical protein
MVAVTAADGWMAIEVSRSRCDRIKSSQAKSVTFLKRACVNQADRRRLRALTWPRNRLNPGAVPPKFCEKSSIDP